MFRVYGLRFQVQVLGFWLEGLGFLVFSKVFIFEWCVFCVFGARA